MSKSLGNVWLRPSKVRDTWVMVWKSSPLTEIEEGYRLPTEGGAPVSLMTMALGFENVNVPDQQRVAKTNAADVANIILAACPASQCLVDIVLSLIADGGGLRGVPRFILSVICSFSNQMNPVITDELSDMTRMKFVNGLVPRTEGYQTFK